MGDERNEPSTRSSTTIEGVRDLCMESHFEYGTRAGWPRIRALLKRHGVRATLNACARARATRPGSPARPSPTGTRSPPTAGAGSGRPTWTKSRSAAPSRRRSPPSRRPPARRRSAGTHARPPRRTRAACSSSTAASSTIPTPTTTTCPTWSTSAAARTWCCPTPSTPTTCASSTAAASCIGEDFARYCIDAFDRLYEEGKDAPRMMSVGLHLRIIGRPGPHRRARDASWRMRRRKPGVWFARRDEIAHAWRDGIGLPCWSPSAPLSAFPLPA